MLVFLFDNLQHQAPLERALSRSGLFVASVPRYFQLFLYNRPTGVRRTAGQTDTEPYRIPLYTYASHMRRAIKKNVSLVLHYAAVSFKITKNRPIQYTYSQHLCRDPGK